jgi:hypothetical protein
MLFDSYGRPIRDMKPIIDKMLEDGTRYKVLPKDKINSYGEYHSDFIRAKINYNGQSHTVVLLEKDDIYVNENVPERYKWIIAVHEYGHKQGLTHPEIFLLELAAIDKIVKINNEPTLKEDYMNWSCSNEAFKTVKGNLGKERKQELNDYPETKYKYLMEKFCASMVIKKGENGNLIQLY